MCSPCFMYSHRTTGYLLNTKRQRCAHSCYICLYLLSALFEVCVCVCVSIQCKLDTLLFPSPFSIRGVGCILYEMATGRPMFPGATVKEELHLIFRFLGKSYQDILLTRPFFPSAENPTNPSIYDVLNF